MAIDVCFSILQYALSPISSFLLWNVIHTCLKNGVDVVTRDYWLVLVWLRSCWVGIECLFKIENSDQMAGLVARLLNMSFQEQCSVQFIAYSRCKDCIFNGIEHVLPDCDCTVLTYTSPYKSGQVSLPRIAPKAICFRIVRCYDNYLPLSCSHGHKGSLMIPKGWLWIRPAQRYPAQNIYLCSRKTTRSTRLEQDVATNITQYWAIMWLHIH